MNNVYFALIFTVTLFISALAQEKPTQIKIEGQIVCCADCWAEADRTKFEYGTAENLLKAKSCVEGGDPTLIAVREADQFKLYQLEQGKFKLTEKNWLGYVGKKVSVTGSKKKSKKIDIFVIDALEVIAISIAETEAKQVIGQQAQLKLPDLFGTDQSLSQYTGRIVVLNFWATYCVPCRQEMPDLAVIQNEYAALGVQVIGASTDEATDRPKVLQFIKETKVNFPVWLGASAADMTRFGLGGALPGTIVIDKNGKIVKVISGVVKAVELKKQIDQMLSLAEINVEKSVASATQTPKIAAEKQSQASSVPS